MTPNLFSFHTGPTAPSAPSPPASRAPPPTGSRHPQHSPCPVHRHASTNDTPTSRSQAGRTTGIDMTPNLFHFHTGPTPTFPPSPPVSRAPSTTGSRHPQHSPCPVHRHANTDSTPTSRTQTGRTTKEDMTPNLFPFHNGPTSPSSPYPSDSRAPPPTGLYQPRHPTR